MRAFRMTDWGSAPSRAEVPEPSTGPGVRGLAEGAPVALAASASCGTCWFCARGMDNACATGLTGRGYGRDGGLADYVLTAARVVAVDPDPARRAYAESVGAHETLSDVELLGRLGADAVLDFVGTD